MTIGRMVCPLSAGGEEALYCGGSCGWFVEAENACALTALVRELHGLRLAAEDGTRTPEAPHGGR